MRDEPTVKKSASEQAMPPDASFWNTRWLGHQTGWDIGMPSPPLTHYLDQYANKKAAILIAGCGNAYEAAYLSQNLFSNITLVDIAPKAVENLKNKFRGNAQIEIICQDFFDHQGKYDLMLEQTFFCAIPPQRRNDYAQKAAELLTPGGKIAGVLFNRTFEKPGPPFGGDLAEYKSVFAPYFQIKTMDPCYNSILPRAGSEVFIIMNKK